MNGKWLSTRGAPRRRFFSIPLVPLACLLLVFQLDARAQDTSLSTFLSVRIIHTNDIHGHISPEPDLKTGLQPPPRLGGAASLAGAITLFQRRPAFGREPDVVLYLDAGDFFQGTPEGTLTRGEVMIDLFNQLHLDAMAAGNHDFDLGTDQLGRLIQQASFPVLSANTVNETTGLIALGLKPHVILDRGSIRIGIFGLITDDMPSITAKPSIAGLKFLPAIETAKDQVRQLQEAKCDLIIGITHAGTETDTRIAESVRGITAIIGGHSPFELSPHIRSDSTHTIIVHTGSYTRHLGVVDILIHRQSRRVIESNARLFRLYEDEFLPDPHMSDWVRSIEQRVGRELDVNIGISDTTYAKHRFKECVIGNLVADAMREASGADAAVMNNRGIRSEIPQGTVRLRDIFTIMPFDNTIVTMTMSGREILELLEEGAGLERDILHVSGIQISVSYEKPAGRRILKALLGGKPLIKSRKYRIATNSFLASGGDLFETFLKGKDRDDTGKVLRDAIRDQFSRQVAASAGMFSGKPEGRITIIGIPPKDRSE